MESEARPSFFCVPLEALVRSCKTKRRADLIQRVGEELRPSHFDVEEEEVHVHALPSRHFAHQALLSHTRKKRSAKQDEEEAEEEAKEEETRSPWPG